MEDIQVDLGTYPTKENKIAVIEAIDGQLITNYLWEDPTITDGKIISDTNKDILKIVVYNRYHPAAPKMALTSNINLKFTIYYVNKMVSLL